MCENKSATTSLVLLLLALASSAVDIGNTDGDGESVELCSSPLGSLSLTRRSALLAAAPSSADPSSPTMVFLDSGPEFGFECASTDPTLALQLAFKRVRGRDAEGKDGVVRASINVSGEN